MALESTALQHNGVLVIKRCLVGLFLFFTLTNHTIGASSSTLSQNDFNKMLAASGQASSCQCDLSQVKADISSNTDQIKGLSANGISDTVISEMNKAGPIKDNITKQITETVQPVSYTHLTLPTTPYV